MAGVVLAVLGIVALVISRRNARPAIVVIRVGTRLGVITSTLVLRGMMMLG
jgi:hypothetical protein